MIKNNNLQGNLYSSQSVSVSSSVSPVPSSIPNIASVIGIGIDVSKAKLDVCLLFESGQKYLQISNTVEDVEIFLQSIQGYSGQIVVEPTNTFHLKALNSSLKYGFKVVLCNPQKAHQFSKFLIGKNKTDKLDSLVLAKIGLHKFFKPLKPNSVQLQESKLLVNQLRTLSKSRQVLKSELKHFLENKILAESEIKGLSASISNLTKTIEVIEDKLERIINNIYSQETLNNLETIPGISKKMRNKLLTLIDTEKQEKEVTSYSGLCPTIEQSGTSLNKKKGISKRGNRAFRALIFQIGFGAGVSKYGFFRGKYDELKNKGRHHTEATLIIGKKVIRIFLAILKSGQKFNPNTGTAVHCTTTKTKKSY